jgi:hypothetical protein
MPTGVAEKKLQQRPSTGCDDGYRFATRTGFVVWIVGRRGPGRIGFLAVHSPRLENPLDNPGVLDCVDS